MKILTVVYSLGKGGTERTAQNFAIGYANLGCDSRVLFTKEDGIRREYLEEKNIPIYCLKNQNHKKYITYWKPQIIHLHSLGIEINEFKEIKNFFPESKIIETNVFSKPSPWVEDIHVSYQLSKWCDWLYHRRSPKKYPTALIPNCVDITKFKYTGDQRVRNFRESYGISCNDIVIGRIGQKFDGKWSILLIELFEEIRVIYENIKLIIVNAPYSIIDRVNKSVFKSDIIHIEQLIGDSNLADCYSSLDVFVLIAEQGESFGMVLTESLLCETPVVTLATPWADNSQGEVIGNNKGGFVAAKKKYLLPLIRKLIDDESLRKKIGKAGRDHIIKTYDLNKVANDSLRICNSSSFKHTIATPNKLMNLTEGRINIFTRLILRSGKLFSILRFTTGYVPLIQFPLYLLRKFRRLI